MNILGPTKNARLNEVAGVVCLALGLFISLALVSYHPEDPSWNTASAMKPANLMGRAGASFADISVQLFGIASVLFPLFVVIVGWRWFRSESIEAAWIRICGFVLLIAACTSIITLGPDWTIARSVPLGGLFGLLLSGYLVDNLNYAGAFLASGTALFASLYLISTFSLAKLHKWLSGPRAVWNTLKQWQSAWLESRRRKRERKQMEKAERRALRRGKRPPPGPAVEPGPIVAETRAPTPGAGGQVETDIPIRTLEDIEPSPAPVPAEYSVVEVRENTPPAEPDRQPRTGRKQPVKQAFSLPATGILNEPPGRNPFDEQELKEIAARIKSKFQEFNVLGSVVQINPGPVVTTFEFKPEAGVKYSRITTLTEDLCLGLQAESILIERIPGKPTVGIEVPNSRREVISLRQVLESDEFQSSPSRMTLSLGKDINGRIKVAALDSMPHLLIAGSTGSGKSVMLNTLIMSVLYKSTPDEVRMIMVDPKRLELGLYEGVPHLLTPVITDAKKATYALRNAVLEMERRLKLLAAQGVRNIDQYNRKVRQKENKPLNLFEDAEGAGDVQPLPYILILIDELADLMMLERANVEESVTRLAQMARAVGMHLVLATQRPSVDVITGLIKANFPARISFRVATRVDSRTILDVMGAEHLLGKGDMLFLPPGSSRLTRVHGAFVTETEINRVVEFWKAQAQPQYDETFLIAPPADEDGELDEFNGEEDPAYRDAVRVVLELGKASTSTLQRRLRLGYGRAARILDMMYRDGIIGPPDGSRPREVLKRPDWLTEVEDRVP